MRTTGLHDIKSMWYYISHLQKLSTFGNGIITRVKREKKYQVVLPNEGSIQNLETKCLFDIVVKFMLS